MKSKTEKYLLICPYYRQIMISVIKYAIAMSLFASLLLILETNGLQSANASFCSPGQNVTICQGSYPLPKGEWQFEANGDTGILNITSVTLTGNVNGTLQSNDTMGRGNIAALGWLCPLDQPCNIKGQFNSFTGKISFTSTPTREMFVPDIRNYTGFESVRTLLDINLFHFDGIGSTNTPQPIKEFGWSAGKICLVMGCIR
jgi:hypothetical protein